jgi:hypothetical protein
MKVFCATKIVIFWTLGVGLIDYWNLGLLERSRGMHSAIT